jgi:hypothetical protein
MKTTFLILGSSFLLGLSLMQMGCYKDNKESMFPTTGICDTTNVTWGKDIQAIVNTSCAISGCHNAAASGGYNLSNFAGVKMMVDNKRFVAVLELGTMPKGAPPLDTCTINKVRSWIGKGALQN